MGASLPFEIVPTTITVAILFIIFLEIEVSRKC